MNHLSASISFPPRPDAHLALTMLIRHVRRVAASQAARVACGDTTAAQACAAVIRHGTSVAVTAHYFGAADIADAIAAVTDQEAARINPAWCDAEPPAVVAGEPA